MKKMMSIIMVLMLIVSITSLALADEAEEESEDENEYENTSNSDENETSDPIDSETEEEVEIMNYSLGAEIRLLQLEKAITRNLLKGEMTVDVLEELGCNITDFIAILEELEILLEQVNDTDPQSNDSVEVFVGLKIDAKNLTKQFRDTVKDLLSDDKYQEVREQIRENLTGELENYSKTIRVRIKQFNKNQMYRLSGIIGNENNSCVNQYMNGTMNLSQLKLQVNKMVNNRTKEKKQEIFSEMKKEKIQNKASITSHLEQVKQNFSQGTQERLQERLDMANEKGNENLAEKIQEKIQNIPGPGGQGNSGPPSSVGNGKGKGQGN